MEGGQVAISPRRTQAQAHTGMEACFCFKHNKFSTAIKVSVALTSFFVSLAGRACGLLSHKISANNLDRAHFESLFPGSSR